MKRMLFVILALAFSTNVVSPLFPLYRTDFALSTSTIAALFAVYALGVLIMLLVGGTFAERFGSLPVATAGALLAVLSAILFFFARGPLLLFTGRIIGGLAVGTFMGTSNSLLLRMTPPGRRTRIMGLSSTLNLFGFGLGPAVGGLWIQFLPHTATRGPFLLLLVMLLAALAILMTVKLEPEERREPEPFAIKLGVPAEGRRLFWAIAGAAIFVSFGFGGIAFSLLPGVATRLFGSSDGGAGGLLVFLMTTTGAVFQLIKRPAASRVRLLAALAMLVLGTWLVVTAELADIPVLILLGTMLQGAGNGWTFQTSLRIASEVAVLGDRIRVMSSYFLCAYLGLSIPSLATGTLAHLVGVVPAITVVSGILTLIIAAATAVGRRALAATAEPVRT